MIYINNNKNVYTYKIINFYFINICWLMSWFLIILCICLSFLNNPTNASLFID